MSHFYPNKVKTSPFVIKSLMGIRKKNAIIAAKKKEEEEAKAAEAEAAAAAPVEVATSVPALDPELTIVPEPAPEVDYSKFTKAKLVDVILAQYGADADVSGTKAELLERYFPEA